LAQVWCKLGAVARLLLAPVTSATFNTFSILSLAISSFTGV